jgi:hypothetical protein
MRRWTLYLLASFLTAPALSATEVKPSDVSVPEVVPSVATKAEPSPRSELQVTRVAVEERAPAREANAAQFPARGSFWWLVGVIVVAGVILAVVL